MTNINERPHNLQILPPVGPTLANGVFLPTLSLDLSAVGAMLEFHIKDGSEQCSGFAKS